MIGRRLCYNHGGKNLVGPANPAYKHGRYSEVLPPRLRDRYDAAEQDGNLLALRSEIALIDARLHDVLGKVDSGESSRLWADLRSAHEAMLGAQRTGDADGLRTALVEVGDLIRRGHGDWAAWADVRALVRDRKVLVESERKRLVEANLVVTVEQALAALMGLVDAVTAHVSDRATLRAVMAEYERLVGVAGSRPAALARGPDADA